MYASHNGVTMFVAADLNFKVFLAEANHVGYTPAGLPGDENDLYRSSPDVPLLDEQDGSIVGEWRRFGADRDGFWTAEARRGDEVARVSVRVTGLEGGAEPVSPWLLFGGLLLLLAIAVGYRILRARARRPRV